MPRFPTLLAAALAALALAGCGGDGDEPGRTVTVPQTDSTLRVVGDEYSFDPEKVVVTGVRAPGQLTVELRNDGSLAHNLRVVREDGDELGGTPTFQGGETRSGTVVLGPGTYRMVCTVGNHADLGMVGELELRE